MSSMSGRPCNPGSDLRALWQTLLGDTPFPQCGVPDKAHSAEHGGRTIPELGLRTESEGPPAARGES
jgi:hypothetical protein